MRILGFSKKWFKLNHSQFTTFRYPRVDKDWQVGELVQIVYKPRRKGGGDKLGIAKIINKEPIDLDPEFDNKPYRVITDAEAIEDGFENREDMAGWIEQTYGLDYISCMNKLTLKWS